ncbi:MAG: 30S ribosomal protein S4 [Bdellovibrionaceae bacterium]|nr:30S ribosomal protein S4 [Pseudobdellovibrionaceae bacterium]
MIKKKTNARFKIQRRLLTELPGLGKSGALERRPYPPGQHGGQRIKYSDFRLQLEEKQKIRYHYNLREEQLVRLVKRAKRHRDGKWISSLVNLLEKRLENVVFRAGIAPSMMAAGQMISHGQITVNGKSVNIRSFVIRKGDTISLTSRGIKNQIYINSKQSPRLALPDWLDKNETNEHISVVLKDEPGLQAVPFPLNEALVVSYYSKV